MPISDETIRALGPLGSVVQYWARDVSKSIDDAATVVDSPNVDNFASLNSSGDIQDSGYDSTSFVRVDGAQDIRQTGEFRIGNAAGTSYTEFEADGTLVFVGDAVVWDDMRVVPGSFDRPGASDPAIVAYAIGGGAVNTYLWEFAKNNIASFTVQLPHNYKVGTDIYAHIHWTPGTRGNEENGAMVGWKIDYTWASIGGAFAALATLDLQDACDGIDHLHQMTPDVIISAAGQGISSMLVCNVKRTDTGTDDTWASAVSGQLPLLLEIDFHYQIDTVGSRQRTAK
jgi:hypothetical protein